jgi:hypothetical protein
MQFGLVENMKISSFRLIGTVAGGGLMPSSGKLGTACIYSSHR